MNKLLERALEAHGGLERWKQFRIIETDVVSSGELLKRKVEQTRGALRTSANMQEQACFMIPVEASDKRFSFRADRVAIETLDGKPVIERLDPRSAFAGHDLDTPWDPLHRGYFGGYAMWSYLTSPFSLTVEGAQVWDIEPLEENGEIWRGIRVALPSRFATHSRAQEFYFGEDMLVRRQDYTLDVAEGVNIANYALDIIDVNGFKLPSKRRAYLCNKKYDVLRDRLIISLDMSNFRVIA
jgi:hypothetical protein